MSENSQKLQIKKEIGQQANDSSLRRDISTIKQTIKSIEKNISNLEAERAIKLGELSEEKNYDIFFYIGGALVLLNLIFNFTVAGLVIATIFAAIFTVYKKYFYKEKRTIAINAGIDIEIEELKRKIAERQKEISKIENQL